MTKQIRNQKNPEIYRDSCETTVLFNESSYTLISQKFYHVIVITTINQCIPFESMEAITVKKENIKTIAI